jgi:hypothetical protein
VFTTSGTYPWSFVTHIFHNGQPSHRSDREIFEVMTLILPVLSGARVTRSLVLYVNFVARCLSFSTFSFGHYVVCSSSIYMDSDCPFDIFKLFLQHSQIWTHWSLLSDIIIHLPNHDTTRHKVPNMDVLAMEVIMSLYKDIDC